MTVVGTRDRKRRDRKRRDRKRKISDRYSNQLILQNTYVALGIYLKLLELLAQGGQDQSLDSESFDQIKQEITQNTGIPSNTETASFQPIKVFDPILNSKYTTLMKQIDDTSDIKSLDIKSLCTKLVESVQGSIGRSKPLSTPVNEAYLDCFPDSRTILSGSSQAVLKESVPKSTDHAGNIKWLFIMQHLIFLIYQKIEP